MPHLGKSYDERVDIFSFGIMLCEVSRSYCFSNKPNHQCRNKHSKKNQKAIYSKHSLQSALHTKNLGCPHQVCFAIKSNSLDLFIFFSL